MQIALADPEVVRRAFFALIARRIRPHEFVSALEGSTRGTRRIYRRALRECARTTPDGDVPENAGWGHGDLLVRASGSSPEIVRWHILEQLWSSASLPSSLATG